MPNVDLARAGFGSSGRASPSPVSLGLLLSAPGLPTPDSESGVPASSPVPVSASASASFTTTTTLSFSRLNVGSRSRGALSCEAGEMKTYSTTCRERKDPNKLYREGGQAVEDEKPTRRLIDCLVVG